MGMRFEVEMEMIAEKLQVQICVAICFERCRAWSDTQIRRSASWQVTEYGEQSWKTGYMPFQIALMRFCVQNDQTAVYEWNHYLRIHSIRVAGIHTDRHHAISHICDIREPSNKL
jgi:hypothetical protein